MSVTRVSGQAQRISFDQETTVYNPSLSVSLLIGNVTPDTRIGPQGAFIMEGGKQYWIASADGSILDVDLLSGLLGAIASPGDVIASLISSTLPTLIAQAVQNAGVPPIDIPASLYVAFNQDVPAGGVFSTGHITMSKYQSYTMVVKPQNGHNNADTIPYMRMTMKWSLAADNFDPIHVEDWVLPVAPFSFTFNWPNYGAGPCYSDTLDIVFTSYDTVINTVTLGVFGSFRQRLRSVLRGQYNWSGSAPVESAGLGSDALLAMISGTALASGASSTPQLVNLWHGSSTLYVQSSDTGVDDLEVHIQPQPAGSLPNETDIVLTMDGSGNFSRLTDILLPRRVCTMFVKNNGPQTVASYFASLIMDGVSE